jgi:hypothetical protein
MKQALQTAFRTARHGIQDIDSLCKHLEIAIRLEHCTIPPYLCALYSIQDGHNQEAAAIIRSVVIEEMLHMALAANVLKALDGTVRLTGKDFPANYPTTLPHSDGDIQVPLAKFSPASVRTFMRIEHPAPPGAPPQSKRYHTIAQFYAAIEKGLRLVCKGNQHFVKDAPQADPKQYYGAYGVLFPIHRPKQALKDAVRALEQIVDQGEGRGSLFPNRRRKEVAHYYRFNEIHCGRLYKSGDTRHSGPRGPKLPIDWDAVYDMHPNPSVSHFKPGSEARRKMEDFNRSYMAMLARIEKSLNENPNGIAQCVPEMYDLKYQAVALMKIPYSEVRDSTVPGAPKKGNLGPSFEHVDPPGGAGQAT